MLTQSCDYYLETADAELQLAESVEIDLSNGLRAAIPSALVLGSHFAKAYINALLALTLGTRTNH